MGLLRWIKYYGNPIVRFGNKHEDFSSPEGEALILKTNKAVILKAFYDPETWEKIRIGIWKPNLDPRVKRKIREASGDLVNHPSLS